MENFTISAIKRTKTTFVVEGLSKGVKKSAFASRRKLDAFGIDVSELAVGDLMTFPTPMVAVCSFSAKGSTFIAEADSSRTKGEVLGENCPEGQENEPLYIKGEEVKRLQDAVNLEMIVSKEVYLASF